MTNAQFFALILGGWIVLLLLLVWVLVLQRKTRPTSLRAPMLVIGLITSLAMLSRTGSLWMTLVVAAMPLLGVWIGQAAMRQTP